MFRISEVDEICDFGKRFTLLVKKMASIYQRTDTFRRRMKRRLFLISYFMFVVFFVATQLFQHVYKEKYFVPCNFQQMRILCHFLV